MKSAPVEVEPVGPDREFACRYCSAVFPSALACREHQAARHVGVGERMVTDRLSDLPFPLRGLRRRR